MKNVQVEIINKLGLHARAAAKFVSTAANFSSSIRLGYEGQLVDGKSIMAVMMLAARKGSLLTLEVEGQDEDAACGAICQLINDRFDEAE